MTTQAKKTANRGKLVGTDHVNQLISNYKSSRWADNSQKIGKNDALSTWYGLTELSDFLALAKTHSADGIKIYYGVYPSDYAGDEMCRDRQTVVFVATKKKTTELGVINKDIYITRNGKSEVLAFNAGEMCPPYCSDWPGSGGGFHIDIQKTGISIMEGKDGLIII